MNYQSIIENVIAAIASALIAAIGVWLLSWTRNLLLERQLKDAINANGVGVTFDPSNFQAAFSLQVHNYSTATIRVRTVIFIADKFHVELVPSSSGVIYQTPLTNEAVRSKFKRMHLSKGSLEPDNNPNSMLLPPKTMGIWEVRGETIGSREWKIKEIFMIFEYATLFGNAAMVRMRANDAAFKLVKEEFERLSTATHKKIPFDLFQGLRRKDK